MALGKLAPVGAMEERQVRVPRRRRPECVEDEQLLGRIRDVILAAYDVGDLRVEVVDEVRECYSTEPSARAITKSSMLAFANRIWPRMMSSKIVSPSSGTCRRTAPSPSGTPRYPRSNP